MKSIEKCYGKDKFDPSTRRICQITLTRNNLMISQNFIYLPPIYLSKYKHSQVIKTSFSSSIELGRACCGMETECSSLTTSVSFEQYQINKFCMIAGLTAWQQGCC